MTKRSSEIAFVCRDIQRSREKRRQRVPPVGEKKRVPPVASAVAVDFTGEDRIAFVVAV
ncbi:hypothetical protein F2Q70_00011626 [Brassica cretica]|uniref:Uncharacterized protein n=1 Tax=Brassica cretica TaxID=69181 RepID=A0A8S9M4S5_BRACR|nr:hypothetical protein F2Q70_00011626 [Brassica cretica]